MKYTFKDTLRSCYLGYITQAIVNNLAPILFIIFQQEFNISFEMIGRLILINFITQIGADIYAVKYVDKIGYRKAGVIAHLFSAVGLIALGILPKIMPNPYLGLVISVMIYAVGGGIIEVIVSPIVESLPGEEKASAMSLLHSFYCWGQVSVVLISTIIIKVLGLKVWFILPILWSIIPMVNLFRFMKIPLNPIVADGEPMSIKELMSSRFFILAIILMMCAGASELTMSQWSSIFAEEGLQVPKMMGDILGPCLFAVFMGIGRTVYGIYGSKIKIEKALLYSGIACVGCYLITVFAGNPFVSLLSCALCGFTVCLMWPGTFSLSAEKFPKGGTAMFGLLAIGGDLGAAIGPWLPGVVTDKASVLYNLGNSEGLKLGVLVGAIFPIILVITMLFVKKTNTSEKPLSNTI